MNSGIEFSKRLAVLSALAVCSTFLMLWLWRERATEQALQLNDLERLANNVSKEIAALSNFGDSNLADLRSRADRSRAFFGQVETMETVVSQFGSSWNADVNPEEAKDGSSVHSCAFSMKSPALTDWPKVVDLLGSLERHPGVGITSFEMRTRGNVENRDVVKLEIVVETRSYGLSPDAPKL